MKRKSVTVARTGGFSLIEVCVATAIIGLGMSALMLAVGSGTKVNAAGQEITQAAFLAGEIREWTSNLPFSDPDPADASNPPGPDGTNPQVFVDDLDDLMDVTYSPPRDAAGRALSDMQGWSQTITLTWLNPNNLSAAVADGASDIVNVNVSIQRSGRVVISADYLVARR